METSATALTASTTRALTEEDHICLGRQGKFPAYYKTRTVMEKDECPFCQLDQKLNKVLYDNDSFHAWEVPEIFLREKNELAIHIVIASKRHLRRLGDLNLHEWLRFGETVQWFEAEYGARAPGGGLLVRFGHMGFNGGTVQHLHANIMVPSGTVEVRLPLAKGQEGDAKDLVRGAEFAKRYEAGEKP